MKTQTLQLVLLLTLGVFLSNVLTAQKLTNKQTTVPATKTFNKGMGDDCSNPYLIEFNSLPYTYTDNQPNGTCGHGNNYDNVELMGYSKGEDVVYKVEVSQMTQANITLTGEQGEGGYWHSISIFEGCPDEGIFMGYANADGAEGQSEITLSRPLEPNKEYFILIDYWGTIESPCLKSYDLSIEFTDDVVHYYDLFIAGEQVNSINATDLSLIDGVTGTGTYDNDNKVLTLDNVNISSVTSKAIHNTGIEGLKINLIGVNTTSCIQCLRNEVSTEISGEGSLKAASTGFYSIYLYNAPLTIKNCSVDVFSSQRGIIGNSTAANLTIENATVKARGQGNGSISSINELTLINCAITAPAGAAFDANLSGVAINGMLVKDQVVIEPTSAVADMQQSNLKVYPNPVTDILNITPEAKDFTVEIYNVLGKLLVSETNNNRISFSNLPEGVYMLKIITDKGISTQKVIKK